MKHDELMEYIDHPDTLPERAYCLLPSDKTQVIIVVNGKKGYYPYQQYPTEQNAKETCEYCNERFSVTDIQAEALMILSMRR